MIFDLLTPPQGPRGRGKKSLTLHAPFMSVTHTPNLVNGQMDGRTDGRTEAITISPSFFLKKRGDNKTACALDRARG